MLFWFGTALTVVGFVLLLLALWSVWQAQRLCGDALQHLRDAETAEEWAFSVLDRMRNDGVSADQWLPLREAAAAMGTDVAALRKRAQQGTVEAEKRDGGLWFVRVRQGAA